MSKPLAPLALFTYNRPTLTRQTLHALANNPLATQTVVYIFSDGPKPNTSQENLTKIQQTREIISESYPFAQTNIILRNQNLGLAQSILSGVSEIIQKHGKIIVLEDDLIPSPFFLQYMNDALNLYESEDKVASIHAYTYPVPQTLPNTFFLRGADCWGWATWKRAWNLINTDANYLLQTIQNQNLNKLFTFNNTYPYTQMLKNQAESKISSWAILWYASMFLENKLTLYPAKSLIKNAGTDGDGTHVRKTNKFNTEALTQPINIKPIPIQESVEARQAFEMYFNSIKEPLLQKIIHRIQKWLK